MSVSHNHVYLVSSASAPCLVILEYLIISGPIRDSLWWMRSILLEDNIVSASVRTQDSDVGVSCSLSRSHIRQVSKMQRTECRGDTFKQVSCSIFRFRQRGRKSTVNSTSVFNPIQQICSTVSTPCFLINLIHINDCTVED